MSRAILLLILVLLSGCGTTAPTGKDFFSRISATKSDNEFFTGKYVGTQKNCFPPPSNRECLPVKQGEVIYKATTQIPMEEFWLSLTNNDFFAQRNVKEILYLAAAEITLQQGFSMFTVVTETYSTNCRSHGYESYSSGNVSSFGNQAIFSGVTSVREAGSCLETQSIRILSFNDKSVLADGILHRSLSDPNQKLHPETSLYFGTIPNLIQSDFIRSEPGFGRISTPKNAWKTHYNASGLASDLRTKHGISDISPIVYKDKMAESLLSSSNDPLKSNRTSVP